MKFCSNCGHSVYLKDIPDDTYPRFFCDQCERIHYQNPNVVVGCLPIWKDQIMLCKRAIEPRKGFWNLPGGYLENGETVEEGAMREVWEEAGIRVTVTGLHTVFSIPKINQVYMHFLAAMPDLNYVPGVESLEVKMFVEADIPWKELAFSSSTFSLKKYFEDQKNGQKQVHLGQYTHPIE